MNHKSILVPAACVLLLAAVSCGGDNGPEEVTAPADTVLNVHLDPVNPAIGQLVAFTVSASNSQTPIHEIAIDYMGDGVWDETQEFQLQAVSAVFTHTYNEIGGVDVFVEVRTANKADRRLVRLNVVADIPVKYTMYGWSNSDGGCYAAGPPATCGNCAEMLGTIASSGVSRSLGRRPAGTIISLEQEFNQWPADPGRHTYGCQFVMHLIAGEPGHEVGIGNGRCETTSTTPVPLLDCRIAVTGTVR